MKIFLDANICLDLLDTQRSASKKSVAWYMNNKDDQSKAFYFSGDFISTFYYVLTQKRKLNPTKVIQAIDALSQEIVPVYLSHSDFQYAKKDFFENGFDDFEDLMVLNSAHKIDTSIFVTNDKKLLRLKKFNNIVLHNVSTDFIV